MPRALFLAWFMLFACSWAPGLWSSTAVDRLSVPAGFEISVYADRVPDARALAIGRRGTLFVGSRLAGQVYAIPPAPGPKGLRPVRVIARNLPLPYGVAVQGNDLYVATANRILCYPEIEDHLAHPPQPRVVTRALPSNFLEGEKVIKVGPDARLYCSIGAPRAFVAQNPPEAGTILRFDLDGRHPEVFSRGVHHALGFDWHPRTRELWFTDQGWSGLPDEIDRATKIDEHFGYPFCAGRAQPDPELADGVSCTEFTAPVAELPSGSHPEGLLFYRGDQFPATYREAFFVAEAGGPATSGQVRVLPAQANAATEGTVFVSGWPLDQGPSGLELTWDGSLLLSDPKAGAIYRISFQPTP